MPHVHVPKQRSGESYADNTARPRLLPARIVRSFHTLRARILQPATHMHGCNLSGRWTPDADAAPGSGDKCGAPRFLGAPRRLFVKCSRSRLVSRGSAPVACRASSRSPRPRSYTYTETFARGLEERVHSVHFWHGTLRSGGATTSYSCIPEAKFPKAPPRHAVPPSRVSGLEQNGKSTLPHGLRSLSRLHGFSASRAKSSSPRRSLKCAL